ncbi:MAG: hypothetical protein WBK43_02285 [Prolixibacteraceae bacterium]|jgi:hypothetical protein|nr:hypothetical protein [Prolixibacteraceae bacterium]MDI9563647.1 hypothetical protein [Bacteroidota bacterium]NLS99517.1 hypothetical protein [Bacteroidales bacterium]OQB78715.1 MAG: hypothetical protein BWX87_02578 [Bacteroidetes bacterium ADurb.Bin123]HNU77907.1 hypothetical protein [Prolixibacteraceae bacterium]
MIRNRKLAAPGTPILLLLLCVLFLAASCGKKKRSEEIKNYAYQEESVELNPQLKAKLDWIKEGTVCYGLVVGIQKDGTFTRGLPVKSKVLAFTKDSIKMKALEAVSIGEVEGCARMGLKRGETWWESEGDLFRTKEEAEEWLAERGLLIVNIQ